MKLVRAIVSKNDCVVYIVQDSGSEASPFIKELESMPGDKNHRKNVFLILFKSEEQHTIKRQYHYILTRREDPSSDASSCAKMVVDEVEKIRGKDRHIEPAESSENRRTENFPDGERNMFDEEKFEEVLNKWGNKLGKKMDEGFTMVIGEVGEAKLSLQEDLEVVHEEIQRSNGPANGNQTVIGPCNST